MSQPVFIAGVGVISAIGNNVAECLDALKMTRQEWVKWLTLILFTGKKFLLQK